MLGKITAAAVLLVSMLFYTGCAENERQPLQPPAGSSTVRDYVENQLLAYVDSQRQAEEIAEKCGITLESCRHGIAVFYTEEDLDSIIALAQQLRLPQLSRNYIYQLYGEE